MRRFAHSMRPRPTLPGSELHSVNRASSGEPTTALRGRSSVRPLPFIVSDNPIDDNSVAFILQYKRLRVLFTGDTDVTAEQWLLTERLDLHATVLKVGHHGSAYSSSPAFIAAVHPAYAVISIGRHNMFGHP